MTTVAALFVETDGCYFGVPNVDPYDIGVMAMVGGKRKTEIRNATPEPFRDVLLAIARGSYDLTTDTNQQKDIFS